MNEKPEKTEYNFPGQAALCIYELTIFAWVYTTIAAVIITVRVVSSDKSALSATALVLTWGLTIVVAWWAKIWHFDYARRLLCTKGISWRDDKRGALLTMVTSLLWPTMAIDSPIIETLRYMRITFVIVGVFIALSCYLCWLPYKLKYPTKSISFLEYCNMPRSAKR